MHNAYNKLTVCVVLPFIVSVGLAFVTKIKAGLQPTLAHLPKLNDHFFCHNCLTL